VLSVEGTARRDRITVRPTQISAGRLQVFYGNFESVQVFAGAGNDLVNVRPQVDMPVLLDGGSGHDRLIGGSGADVLLGGSGNDRLYGNGGNDLLIGGTGRDRLDGGQDDDILVAGWTIHDRNVAALQEIMAIWTSDDDYETRESTIRDDYLNLGTVTDDFVRDRLFARLGRDWWLHNPPRDRVYGPRR
jgi:Ca2+-binding RTX toxin-like protein